MKQKAGFKGLRAATEMKVFFDHARSIELFRYEAALVRQLASNLCGLCLYDANRVGEDLIQVFDFHGYMISRGIVWEDDSVRLPPIQATVKKIGI